MVTVMTRSRRTLAGERIIQPMIDLAGCSKLQPIMVVGAKSVEIMLELSRRGYVRVASAANCGHRDGQFDVALVDWRQRTFRALETTLDWLADFLSPAGVLVIWLDSHKPAAAQDVRSALERRGFVVEAGTMREDGCAVSAHRSQMHPISKAA
jgi:hypothetical protein